MPIVEWKKSNSRIRILNYRFKTFGEKITSFDSVRYEEETYIPNLLMVLSNTFLSIFRRILTTI
jgi:hypothetical protein